MGVSIVSRLSHFIDDQTAYEIQPTIESGSRFMIQAGQEAWIHSRLEQVPALASFGSRVVPFKVSLSECQASHQDGPERPGLGRAV